jgi:hypothetical protein
MSVSYTCPNADCGVTLKTANPVPQGKRVKCPKCQQMFAPVPPVSPPSGAAGTFQFADDGAKKKPAPSKSGSPKPPPAPAPKKPVEEEEESNESIKKGYGVIKESQEELEAADKAKVKFGDAVEDKYKKSARGPAVALLVMPSNLLTGEGLITAIGGLVMFLVGMWPLAFNDAPPGDEETEEAILMMLLGFMTFFWGSLICFGASQMQELKSYLWAMMGAVMGVLPLLVGIFAIIMLQNPKVKAGFEESEAGAEDDEDLDKDKDDEDGEDEDEEDDDDD